MSKFCLWVDTTKYPEYIRRNSDSMFGIKKGGCKGSNIESVKDIDGAKLFLVSCYDLYEDGYCIFATKEGVDVSSSDFGNFTEYEIIADVEYRGNCRYPSEYGNKYAGEKTFEHIQSLEDFSKLKENRYCFM